MAESEENDSKLMLVIKDDELIQDVPIDKSLVAQQQS